jgi:uncharacterized protein GlcG (DUF336 family)
VESLESRELMAVLPNSPAILAQLQADANIPLVTETEVQVLLARAAAASKTEDAIIAVVDREGHILGVRMEDDVLANITDEALRVFAIDGAVAKARTAAFFASDEAPLTSRTIRNLSQSTITQREVQSNPNVPNPLVPANDPFNDASPTARTYGPGFVAPIGVGGHFPQGIMNTPPVDLFGIEHQSRDSIIHPGLDGYKGSLDDIMLAGRCNIDPAFDPAFDPDDPTDPGGKALDPPESYGFQSDRLRTAQSRGIATLPGGIPLIKVIAGRPELVGGIGVFFPGLNGDATFEQHFVQAPSELARPQTNEQRLNAPKVLEAEWIAFAAAGGASGQRKLNGQTVKVGEINDVPALPSYDVQAKPGRIDLVGITLEVIGPNPSATNRIPGVETIARVGASVQPGGDGTSGDDQIVTPGGDFYLMGDEPAEGWLVLPHASPTGASTLTAADVDRIINQGIAEADHTRAAIRLNFVGPVARPGRPTKMVFAVADRDGNVLGLYRMKDATVFSIDVAVAKARNTAYYADAGAIQNADLVDDDILLARGSFTPAELARERAKTNGVVGSPDLYTSSASNVLFTPSKGDAFSSRTFRFLAEPRYPAGIDGLPPIFSILNEVEVPTGVGKTRINRKTAENIGQPMLASQFQTVLGFDAFHAGRNFHDVANIANQNGVVFFPGSSPLYVGATLQGGFGVSGDGVDQDDVVTFYGQIGYGAPTAIKADQIFYRSVRLPFQKFNRAPLRVQ